MDHNRRSPKLQLPILSAHEHPWKICSPNHHTRLEPPPKIFVDFQISPNDLKTLQTAPCRPLWPQTPPVPDCIFAPFWYRYASHPISLQRNPALLLYPKNILLVCFLPVHKRSLRAFHVHVICFPCISPNISTFFAVTVCRVHIDLSWLVRLVNIITINF